VKRSTLTRRTALKRSGSLRTRRKPTVPDIGREAWKTSRAGYCACGCGRFSMHLHGHHVIPLEVIKREKRLGLAWDERNRIDLHEICHGRHHSALHKLSMGVVPVLAREFAAELLGEARAADYFARHYAGGERWA